MNRHTSLFPARRIAGRQHGLSMLFALMTLVVLSLAAVALVRSVDNASMIIGNLGFQQRASAASSRATEEALAWLTANSGGATLDKNGAAGSGYFATSMDALDVTGRVTSKTTPLALVDWLANLCAQADADSFNKTCVTPKTVTADLGTGFTAKYVIMRMCAAEGAMAAGNTCSRPKSTSTSTAADRGEISPGGRIATVVSSPYYRVVVRTQGPRNTVTFSETIVHF